MAGAYFFLAKDIDFLISAFSGPKDKGQTFWGSSVINLEGTAKNIVVEAQRHAKFSFYISTYYWDQ